MWRILAVLFLSVELFVTLVRCAACAAQEPVAATPNDNTTLKVTPAESSDGEGIGFFEKHVRPLLIKRCFQCHGGTKSGGGLSLGTASGWKKGGQSGPAITPGQPKASLLIDAISYQSMEMPPEDAGGKLSDEEIAVLTNWVAMGAPDPRIGDNALGGMSIEEANNWWAFQPIPEFLSSQSETYIDSLIDQQYQARQLSPSPQADKRTLIRRATYDLTGLPPTQAEIADFLAEKSPEAFTKVIDRLLQSPQYGVHWGRHWLDVVRYADTAGENTDRPLSHAWRYRNWVIDSFNRDLPFDQFVQLQLAGDLIAVRSQQGEPALPGGVKFAEAVTATGYLAIARRFGHDIDKDMYLTHEDVIDNLGKNFLGLTLGCARCHDHKYDPITAEDYYALYGIFDSTQFAFPGCEPKGQPRDLVPLVSQSEIEEVMQPWRERQELAKTERQPLSEPEPTFPVAYAVVDRECKNARIHQRGDPEKLGDEVPRRWLSVFGGWQLKDPTASGRLELAHWVTAHPLLARVMVNRIWEWHFGRGLTRYSNDFGARGEKPTHPELHDLLAADFIRSGYSVKGMHRRIMASAAYQRSSAAPSAADPTNDWLTRYTRRRLSAEELRDSLLVAAGSLDGSFAEAHPFPSESTWTFTQHAPFSATYETNRRSAFLMVQRQRREPFLWLFDGADPNASTPSRPTTTVPTQALYFMNDLFFHQQAATLSQELINLSDDSARGELLIGRLFQRAATAAEQNRMSRFVSEYPGELSEKWTALTRVLMATNEFLHVE